MPSLIERVMERFGYLRADSRLPQVVRTIGEQARLYGPQGLDLADNEAKAYQKVSWVYASITRICSASSVQQFKVMKKVQEEEQEVIDHPFEQLLRRPNPFMSRSQLWDQTVGYMKLVGNAFWYLNHVNGKPAEIWPLQPSRMHVVADKKKYIKGWIHDVDGRETWLEREEVVHFPEWNPRSDYKGLSPIQAAALAAETDNAASEFNKNFFGPNAAKLAGMVVLPETTPDHILKRVQKEWTDSYGGTENRTAFIRSGAASWQDTQLSQRDMQWLEGRQFGQEEIMTGIYGIPPGLYRESATQANAEVAWKAFFSWVIWPMLVRISEIVTAQVIYPYYGKDLEGQFDDPRPEDRRIAIDEMKVAMENSLLTVDEARARYFKMDPLPLSEREEEREGEEEPPQEQREEVEDAGSKAELEKWERKARRWLKEHGTANAPFAASTLPAGVAGAIQHRLATAKTPEEVKTAFAVPF